MVWAHPAGRGEATGLMPRPLQILTSVWSINRRSRTFPILGARRADVGQRDASWVVLADPEGNEFCILGGRVRPDS
ncbi:MAG: glyoxalase [Propionibacteriaceae bacterium]|nr:glyoxalase [Propionibacteriaceae bacterium]